MQVLPQLGLGLCKYYHPSQRNFHLEHPLVQVVPVVMPRKALWQDFAQCKAQRLRNAGMLQQCGRQAALAQAGVRHADQVMDHQDVDEVMDNRFGSIIARAAAPCERDPEPLKVAIFGQPVAEGWPECARLAALVQQARNCLLALLLRQRSQSAAPLSCSNASTMTRLMIPHAATTLSLQAFHALNDDALRNEAR